MEDCGYWRSCEIVTDGAMDYLGKYGHVSFSEDFSLGLITLDFVSL